MRARSLLSFLLAGSSLLACNVLGDDAATQEAAHTAGDPTFAQHSWLWADESEEEFRRHAEDSDFLPLDHPVTKRLQFWVDRMDDALRSESPEKLKATPRPRVIVEKSSTPNAWVTALPVAWSIRTRVAGHDDDAGGAAAPSERELLIRRNGAVDTAEDVALERSFSRAQLAELTRFYNENFSTCRLRVEGEELVFAETCRNDALLARGDRFAYHATSKFITFTTGYILQLLDEDRIVSTLAHELGHFYRSHANMPTDTVNYFYSLDERHAHKPPPDPRFFEQTARVREKLRGYAFDWDEENELMKTKNLGFYTHEQEADELALELMSKVGVPPGVAIDKVLNMLKNASESDPNAVKWADCAMLREHGWRDADGTPVSVPVGDPSRAHHNLCFRAFNMSREIAAHRYAVAERPAPPGEAWSRLLTQLAAEIDPVSPPTPQPADAGADDS